jgi:predicted amidohydrolase
VGSGDGLVFVGGSRSIAPTGEILAEASRDQEELLVVPIAELGGFDPRTDVVVLEVSAAWEIKTTAGGRRR